MDIDNKNFQKEKENIINHIRKSSLIAFDFEFTGLTTDNPGCRETDFQDENEHYERVKQISANFCILQFGIACFEYKDGVYQSHCYNIYTRKPPKGKGRRNMFICDGDSLEFLAANQMDFKRVFQNGVFSRRLSERQQAIEEISERLLEKKTFDFQYLSPKDEILFKQVQENLLKVLQSGKQGVVDFQSKVILSSAQKKYMFNFGDKSKKEDLKQFEHVIKGPKGNKYLIKQEQDAEKKIDKARLEELIHEEMGVSELVEEMIKCKVPIVGHWNHLDVGFLYNQFIAPLPSTYLEYEADLINCFPYIYDTKVVSRSIQKQIKGIKVDLQGLSEGCYNPALLGNYNNVVPPKVNKYEEGKFAHEAGYDAYITGLVFIAMSNFIISHTKIETKQTKPKKSKQEKQEKVEYNPKQLPKFPEINYEIYPKNQVTYSKCSGQIQMGEKERSTKFDHFLVIEDTFKGKQKQLKSICETLKEYGSLKISIRDKVYIQFIDKQDTANIINQNPQFKLIHYKDRNLYQSTLYL